MYDLIGILICCVVSLSLVLVLFPQVGYWAILAHPVTFVIGYFVTQWVKHLNGVE